MPPRLRRLLDLLIVCAALVSMLGAPMLVRAHEAAVHHVRCLEHGELVELAEAGPSVHQDHREPVIVPGHAGGHHAHCAIDHGLASADRVAGLHLDRGAPALVEAPALCSASPRGPPTLSFAPKTSPPTCA